jgi:threonyl-tRNA synthetase
LIDGLESGGLDEDGNPMTVKVEISTFTHDTFTDSAEDLM